VVAYVSIQSRSAAPTPIATSVTPKKNTILVVGSAGLLAVTRRHGGAEAPQRV
jgi:hypothetical protein